MSEMLEKAARRLAEALGDNLDDAFANKSEWNAARGEKGGRFRDINEPFRDDYLQAARAVLEALREPSGGMLKAGAEGYGEASVADFEEDAIRMAHTAMIDHVLKES